MNADTKGKLEGKRSRQRSIVVWGAIAVVVGLALEIWLAWKFPHGQSFMEIWGTAIATAVIALGVVVETIWGHRGDSTSDALGKIADQLTAEANERAAKAQERTAEIEKLTAWRRIAEEKSQTLVSAIAPFAEQIDLLIEYQSSDPEAYLFAKEILDIFWRAGVPHFRFAANSYLSGNVFDTWISSSPLLGIESIVAALSDAGIDIRQYTKDL